MGKSLRWWQRTGGTVLVLSIGLHVLFIVIAGYFVVQRFMNKPKPTPPLESLANKSESVKVQLDIRQKTMSAPAVKKKVVTSNPLSKVTLPEMPDVPTENVMPSVMPGVGQTWGTGNGPGGSGNGNGGMQNSTFFGTPGARVGLIGTLYDFKQTTGRQKVDGMTMDKYADNVKKFVSGGFNPAGVLSKYYKVKNAIASTMIFIPNIPAEEGPAAFRVSNRVEPKMWIVHYHGTVIPPVSGRYYFVGAGDDVMLVGFNGKLVMDRCWNMKIKDSTADYHYNYTGIPGGFARGDPIEVVAGQQYPIDIVIGEEPGGKLFSFLFIAKEGETPKTGPTGDPIFPVFRVANVKLPNIPAGLLVPPYDADAPPWSIWKTVNAGPGVDTGGFFRQH